MLSRLSTVHFKFGPCTYIRLNMSIIIKYENIRRFDQGISLWLLVVWFVDDIIFYIYAFFLPSYFDGDNSGSEWSIWDWIYNFPYIFPRIYFSKRIFDVNIFAEKGQRTHTHKYTYMKGCLLFNFLAVFISLNSKSERRSIFFYSNMIS